MDDGIAEVLCAHEGAGQDSLVKILLELQEKTGCLSEKALRAVGKHLDIPLARVFSLATFYDRFRFKPAGKYHLLVCSGTACHLKGSDIVLEAVKARLGLEPGQTSRDGRFSLESVPCLGACGLSPLIAINGEFHARVTPNRALSLIEALDRKEEEDAEKAGAAR